MHRYSAAADWPFMTSFLAYCAAYRIDEWQNAAFSLTITSGSRVCVILVLYMPACLS